MKLVAMDLQIKFDRPAGKEHYIIPGGYEMNGKNFDFNETTGYIDKEDKTIIHFELDDFNGDLGCNKYENKPITITEKDIKKGFTEFYIYTGEIGEPEILPVEILEMAFHFNNGKSLKADKKILESANKAMLQ